MDGELYIKDHLGNIRRPEITKFPGGEVCVRLPEWHLKELCTGDVNEEVNIYTYIRSSDDFMALAQLVDIIRTEYVGYIYLHMPYIPYARQDRRCNVGEALSAKVFASLLNSLELDSVLVSDPHSDVAPALINNCCIESQSDLFMESYYKRNQHKEDWSLVSPDAGANKKTAKLAKELGHETYIKADKVRNLATGEITATEVYCGDLTGKSVLMVDDICDGGRTFIELAKVLREKGAYKVGLHVTHGIFSKGKEPLLEVIDEVYSVFDWID